MALAAIMLSPAVCQALPPSTHLSVYGGPTYTPGVGGFLVLGSESEVFVSDAGTAVATLAKDAGSDMFSGLRAVRWDSSGTAATELGNLGTVDGVTNTYVFAINPAGAAVGRAYKYDGSGHNLGERAVRWAGSGTAAEELGHLGTDASGTTFVSAKAINAAGTAVGYAALYDATGNSLGQRPVRWDGSGTAAAELGILGTDLFGFSDSEAAAINDAGTAVGSAEKYDGSGNSLGTRAVRWNSSGTAPIELGHLGTDASGITRVYASAINNAGTAVGYAEKYDDSGNPRGVAAVRWDGSGTSATELGNLGHGSSGFSRSPARDINNVGTAVGFAEKYDGSGNFIGDRAARWDASGTAVTELGNLGTTTTHGFLSNWASAINDAGTAVGFVIDYEVGSEFFEEQLAVYWPPDGVPVDLNTLIDPDSGWRLISATAISNSGWIAGVGEFDPDGSGSQEPYQRLYLIHVPATAVPEPAAFATWIIGCVALSLSAARRRSGRIHYHPGMIDASIVTQTLSLPLIAATFACSTLWCGPANAADFMGLGDLPGGDFHSVANGVSADGSVVVGTSGNKAFRWTQGTGIVELRLSLFTISNQANAVSADGSTVVGNLLVSGAPVRPGSFRYGYRWTTTGGWTSLGQFSASDIAADVSVDGSVVVGSRNNEAFRWTQAGGMVGLGDLPGGGFGSRASGVSDDGSVVVGWGTRASGSKAFRWTEAGGMVDLGDLPGGATHSLANDVSAAGAVVVGQGTSPSGGEAFLWTQASGMVGLGDLPGGGFFSTANGVSSDGAVVVGHGSSASGAEAFLWDATHGMRSLQVVLINDFGLGASLAGWTLNSANAISPDGQFIVGSGTNPSGNTEAWLASLAPQPSLPGDYNQNGTVDAADYTVWRDRLGQSFALANENPAAATPGLVDAEDYSFWKANFGNVSPQFGAGSGTPYFAPAGTRRGGSSPGANVAAPEPSCLALVVGGLGWSLGVPRWPRRRDD